MQVNSTFSLIDRFNLNDNKLVVCPPFLYQYKKFIEIGVFIIDFLSVLVLLQKFDLISIYKPHNHITYIFWVRFPGYQHFRRFYVLLKSMISNAYFSSTINGLVHAVLNATVFDLGNWHNLCGLVFNNCQFGCYQFQYLKNVHLYQG